VETHVYNVALGLVKIGVSTEVFTTDLRTDIPFRRFDAEVPPAPPDALVVRRFRAMKALELPHGLGILSPSMALALFQDEPGLVHAHAYGYFPVLAGGLAELLRGMPLVVTAHSDPGGHTLSKRLFDWAVPAVTLRRADRVIALTNIEALNLRRLGVEADRIRVIPNGVDLKEFEDVPKRREPGDEFALLFVGRCYPRQKGLEHLISALRLLLAKWKIHLTIAGEDWGGTETLRALAKALGVEKHITFTGALPRRDVINAYASADAFVLPSLFEPFGIVLLEAMAAGLPVIASRVGGIAEVVSDGKTGLLVQTGDSQSLANAVASLISDADLRRRLGAAGRVQAAGYSWDGIVPQILDVYHDAMAEGGRERAG